MDRREGACTGTRSACPIRARRPRPRAEGTRRTRWQGWSPSSGRSLGVASCSGARRPGEARPSSARSRTSSREQQLRTRTRPQATGTVSKFRDCARVDQVAHGSTSDRSTAREPDRFRSTSISTPAMGGPNHLGQRLLLGFAPTVLLHRHDDRRGPPMLRHESGHVKETYRRDGWYAPGTGPRIRRWFWMYSMVARSSELAGASSMRACTSLAKRSWRQRPRMSK